MLVADSPLAVAALVASLTIPSVITVSTATFEQLLDVGLLEARRGQFYYKDSKMVVRAEEFGVSAQDRELR